MLPHAPSQGILVVALADKEQRIRRRIVRLHPSALWSLFAPPRQLQLPRSRLRFSRTRSFRLLLAEKPGERDAGMVIALRVCGLTPRRARRSRTSNVPNPVRTTFSPLARLLAIVSSAISMTCR